VTKADGIVFEHLRHIRSAVDALREDMCEIKGRVGILEDGCALLMSRLDRIEARVDRLSDRIERVEKRLDLAEV
jgi:predicted nuclease with TOPRIM domain